MYDGPYCSERMGPNYGAGSTQSEMEEYWGDDLIYEPEHVAAVEEAIAIDNLLAENARITADRDYWRQKAEEQNL